MGADLGFRSGRSVLTELVPEDWCELDPSSRVTSGEGSLSGGERKRQRQEQSQRHWHLTC